MTPVPKSDRERARSFIRRAARAVARKGWRATTSGLLFQGAEGHWGRIDAVVGVALDQNFEAAVRDVFPIELVDAVNPLFSERVPIQLFASIASPYLLQVTNHRDPAKPAPMGYAHAWLLMQVELAYDSAATGQPSSLSLPQAYYAETGIVVGPDFATDWFASLFLRLQPELEGLASDAALRDYLLRTVEPTNWASLRDAALLTKHLGRDDELPSVINRAGTAHEAARALGGPWRENDRDTNMMMWSHDHFVRFLEAVP